MVKSRCAWLTAAPNSRGNDRLATAAPSEQVIARVTRRGARRSAAATIRRSTRGIALTSIGRASGRIGARGGAPRESDIDNIRERVMVSILTGQTGVG